MSESNTPQTTSSPITVRDAGPSDWAVVADYNARLAWETEHKRLDAATLTAGVQAALADTNKARYFLAELDGRVVGQLMITTEWSDWRNGPVWWLQSVYVSVEARRLGVFRRLYRHVDTLARASGVVGIRLYVERENTAAQATYTRLGMSLSDYRLMEVMWVGDGD